MSSIGLFRAANYQPQLASDTVLHNGYVSNQRHSARQHAELNKKPKVGSLDSSQRTYLRGVSTTINHPGMSTPHTKGNVNTVNSALRRVRSAGTVPPPKKSAVY